MPIVLFRSCLLPSCMDTFLRAIRLHTTVSDEEVERFRAVFKLVTYQKGELLLEAGKVAHEVFFVEKGGLRQFFTNEKGLVKTCNLTFEGEFLTDLESFANKTASTTNIMALERSSCLVATCDDLISYMAASPEIAAFFNGLVEKIATANIRRIQSLLSRSPEEQLEDLLNERPLIMQRVPQRYIAEYLGVAPESLSRIRKRMLASAKSEPVKS